VVGVYSAVHSVASVYSRCSQRNTHCYTVLYTATQCCTPYHPSSAALHTVCTHCHTVLHLLLLTRCAALHTLLCTPTPLAQRALHTVTQCCAALHTVQHTVTNATHSAVHTVVHCYTGHCTVLYSALQCSTVLDTPLHTLLYTVVCTRSTHLCLQERVCTLCAHPVHPLTAPASGRGLRKALWSAARRPWWSP